MMSNVQKLRIHALIMRAIELEQEYRLRKVAVYKPRSLGPTPMIITECRPFKEYRVFETQPNKFFDKPKNNFKKR